MAHTQKNAQAYGKTSCTIGKPIDPALFKSLDKKEAQAMLTKALEEAMLSMQSKGN